MNWIGVAEEPHGPEAVLINAQHPWAELIPSGRVSRQASFSAARTAHHETPNATAVSDTARPGWITASTTWSRSRPVERACRGTRLVASKNESRGQAGSWQYHRYLDQRTSTAPATGMSLTRWMPLSFRRDATAPQVGQPDGWSVSIMIRCRPSASTRGDDAVLGQTEDDSGSVRRHTGRLSQGSWCCPWLNARHTHPSRATVPLF